MKATHLLSECACPQLSEETSAVVRELSHARAAVIDLVNDIQNDELVRIPHDIGDFIRSTQTALGLLGYEKTAMALNKALVELALETKAKT